MKGFRQVESEWCVPGSRMDIEQQFTDFVHDTIPAGVYTHFFVIEGHTEHPKLAALAVRFSRWLLGKAGLVVIEPERGYYGQ